MARQEWFRRTSWTAGDEIDFQSRLTRSRDERNRAQYLRIQASHLALAGNHRAALQLLEQLLRDYPVRGEMATAHLQRAESFLALGDEEDAIASFRASLIAESDHPNIRTNAALDFAWFIATRRRRDLYPEVEALIERYASGPCGLLFPVERFKAAAVRALVAADEGDLERARSLAAQANAAAAVAHSGLRYHPNVGLVGDIPADVAKRLAAIGTGA